MNEQIWLSQRLSIGSQTPCVSLMIAESPNKIESVMRRVGRKGGRGAAGGILRGTDRRKKFSLLHVRQWFSRSSLTKLWKKTCFYHQQTVQSLIILLSCSRVVHICFPLEPGEPSCANGWSLNKNSCFMNSARTVHESWYRAYDYCNKSSARLAKVSSDSESLDFIRDLAKQVNASSVWIGSRKGAHFRLLGDNSHNPQSGNGRCAKIVGIRRTLGKCTEKLPFICERGERITVP